MPSQTFVMSAITDDGYVRKTGSTNWPPDTATDVINNDVAVYPAKELVSAGNYQIINPLLKWDTSALPDNAVISAASLSIYISNLGANTNSKVMTADWYTWTMAAADYTATAGTNAIASWDYTANAVNNAYNTIPLLNADDFISRSGYTYLRLHLSDGGTPTGRNWFQINAYDSGSQFAAQLTLGYTVMPGVGPGDAYIQIGP